MMTLASMESLLRPRMDSPKRLVSLALKFSFLAAWLGFPVAVISAPVAAPEFTPNGGTWPAPLKVTIRGAASDAEVHVTLDGSEPTQRDTEVEIGSSVLMEAPGTLKAKAWRPDGTASPTATAAYALRPVEGHGAVFSDQAVPAIMAAGRAYPISVTLRNIGSLPWSRGLHALAPHRAKSGTLWNLAPIELKKNAATWSSATFQTKVTAPAEPGTYNLAFRMQTGGQSFGEATPVVRVVVLTAADFERENSAAPDAAAFPGTGAAKPSGAGRATTTLSKSTAAALARAKAALNATAAATFDRLTGELQRSPRSFRYLRTLGFSQSDGDFERLIAEHPALFKSVRIVRRDENGQRVIPGWPGLALQTDR